MMGDFIYSEEIDREEAEQTYDTPQKIEKNLKRFLMAAALFICGGIIWIFCINPLTVPAKIDVIGFPGFNKPDVLQFAGINGGATYISVNAAATERLLSAHHLVESVRVVKHFPDRLSIFLEPRRAVAVSLIKSGGRTLPVYIDRNGVVLEIGNAAGEMLSPLMPVVSGVFEGNQQLWLGMPLSDSFLPLFSRIGAINDEDPNIWQAISEIKVAPKSNGLYDLVLYPVNGAIRLRMGSDITIDSISKALLMHEVSVEFGNSIPDEIDVRSGIGVIRDLSAY